MIRRLATLAVVLLLAGCSTAGAASTTPIDIGAGVQGPPGATASVYATGLPNVAALAFDGNGRLWAATAADTDDGADGVFLIPTPGAAPVPVVTGLHTVLGLLWVGDTLYVASAGRVDAYSAFDGKAFGRHRAVIVFATGIGEVNGIALAPDGRLVVGISAPCDACQPTIAGSASVVSFTTEGTDLQVVASGIRAPVGLAYMPGTDDLFVSMNQRDDLGDATPGDWLGVVKAGQDWGFPDCYGQADAVCADAPDPVAVLDQHAAASGVALLPDGLGTIHGPVALVAEWATGTILTVALTKDRSTWTGTASPFVTGIKNPVAVVVAPDGSILVGDWGTGTISRIGLPASAG